ncbi:ABC transporter ATP-binding protein [Lysobacter ciconiae]|uniref:ABC transporter ATP-binding protein n=1 Tax=Novilysobacter ciconiae TaxID=2781022 RepID=A0A7S6ZT43_9GAMM|nr:ABC transporter ATP-binding protein [Lysobacter ciconiae]QOW20540.1 ABC transporter ATP-binding protein [Lysobacter ciconiae]
MSAIAQWDGVTKRYGNVVAVRDVNLALHPGEATALVGHNGAGKTTLIKLLLGLIRPEEGVVRVSGIDPAGAQGAEARRALGFLPENVAFHGAMTGNELMTFYAGLKGHSTKRNRELLALVGIADAAGRRVSTYSKGMRQRLGIAQALIGEPRLLLFDEPTSGLDPASRIDVFNTIDMLRGSGATVLVSTHALAEVENRVDRVAVMHRGNLLSAGTLEDLRQGVVPDVGLRVRVRNCETERLLAALPPGIQCTDRTEDTLMLGVPAADKMAALRALASLGESVEDIRTVTPGLEDLYRRLVQQEASAA